jgi:hypothetical protein
MFREFVQNVSSVLDVCCKRFDLVVLWVRLAGSYGMPHLWHAQNAAATKRACGVAWFNCGVVWL